MKCVRVFQMNTFLCTSGSCYLCCQIKCVSIHSLYTFDLPFHLRLIPPWVRIYRSRTLSEPRMTMRWLKSIPAAIISLHRHFHIKFSLHFDTVVQLLVLVGFALWALAEGLWSIVFGFVLVSQSRHVFFTFVVSILDRYKGI